MNRNPRRFRPFISMMGGVHLTAIQGDVPKTTRAKQWLAITPRIAPQLQSGLAQLPRARRGRQGKPPPMPAYGKHLPYVAARSRSTPLWKTPATHGGAVPLHSPVENTYHISPHTPCVAETPVRRRPLLCVKCRRHCLCPVCFRCLSRLEHRLCSGYISAAFRG